MNEYLSHLELNQIDVERSSLTFAEAIGVWLMRQSGSKQQRISARFGTNMGRVADVLTEKTHIGSRQKALDLARG